MPQGLLQIEESRLDSIGFLLEIRPSCVKWAPRTFSLGGYHSHPIPHPEAPSLKLELASTSVQGVRALPDPFGTKTNVAGPLPSGHLPMSRQDRSWPKGDCDVHFRGESERQTWKSEPHLEGGEFQQMGRDPRDVEQDVQR